MNAHPTRRSTVLCHSDKLSPMVPAVRPDRAGIGGGGDGRWRLCGGYVPSVHGFWERHESWVPEAHSSAVKGMR